MGFEVFRALGLSSLTLAQGRQGSTEGVERFRVLGVGVSGLGV